MLSDLQLLLRKGFKPAIIHTHTNTCTQICQYFLLKHILLYIYVYVLNETHTQKTPIITYIYIHMYIDIQIYINLKSYQIYYVKSHIYTLALFVNLIPSCPFRFTVF